MIWVLITLLISGCVAVDQWTKYLTVEHLKPIGDFPLIDGWLHLNYVENTGMAFGMFRDNRGVFLVLSTIGIILLLAFLIYQRKKISVLGIVALAEGKK